MPLTVKSSEYERTEDGNDCIGKRPCGFELKEAIKKYLVDNNYDIMDFGTNSPASVDYPTFGRMAAEAVASGECDKGIVCCGTGIGISIVANKVKGIRCALCTDEFTAEMSRKHNDANMLAMGAGMVGPNLAERIVEVFLHTDFEGGRHARRVGLITEMEEA